MTRYLELQPGFIAAGDGAEFRGLLRSFRERVELSGGQVACGAGLDRKVVYRLGYPPLKTLPHSSEQVERYVKGCRLSPADVTRVMDLWAKLDQARRSR